MILASFIGRHIYQGGLRMDKLTKYRRRPLELFDEMKKAFDSFFDEDASLFSDPLPAVDVREEEDRYVVEADLPGMEEDDLEVSVNNDVLTIASEKEEESEDRKKGFLIRERKQASFRRTFRLPPDVDSGSIDASFDNGVLTVELPRSETGKPRRIAVKRK
jgi:HSP20 family molecular chaperone IbpA